MPLPTPLSKIGDLPAPHALRWVARGGDESPYQWDFDKGEHFRQEDATRWICSIAAAHGWPVTIRIVALEGEKSGSILADGIIWTADAHLERGQIPKMPGAAAGPAAAAAAADGTNTMLDRVWAMLTTDLEMTRALIKTIREGWDALAPTSAEQKIVGAGAPQVSEAGAPPAEVQDVQVRVEFVHSDAPAAHPGLALWAKEVGVELEGPDSDGCIWAVGARSRLIAGAKAMEEFGWQIGKVIWLEEPVEIPASSSRPDEGARNVS